MKFVHLCARIVAFATPVTVTIINTVGYVVGVNGISMQDTLHHNDWVFLSPWKVFKYQFSHGEVVCLISPKNPDEMLVKRVVGLEGDIVIPYMGKHKGTTITVPKGHCWVEGDNKKRSIDSNIFGSVSVGLIKGKIFCKIETLTEIERVQEPTTLYKRLIHGSDIDLKFCELALRLIGKK